MENIFADIGKVKQDMKDALEKLKEPIKEEPKIKTNIRKINYNLGIAYEFGYGCEQNDKKAFEYVKKLLNI